MKFQIGDRVLVEKVAYRFRAPERGEIIVFQRPGAERARSGVSGERPAWTVIVSSIVRVTPPRTSSHRRE